MPWTVNLVTWHGSTEGCGARFCRLWRQKLRLGIATETRKVTEKQIFPAYSKFSWLVGLLLLITGCLPGAVAPIPEIKMYGPGWRSYYWALLASHSCTAEFAMQLFPPYSHCFCRLRRQKLYEGTLWQIQKPANRLHLSSRHWRSCGKFSNPIPSKNFVLKRKSCLRSYNGESWKYKLSV